MRAIYIKLKTVNLYQTYKFVLNYPLKRPVAEPFFGFFAVTVSHMEVMEMIVGNFEKTQKRYQNSVFRAWCENVFSPYEVPTLKQYINWQLAHLYFLSYFAA